MTDRTETYSLTGPPRIDIASLAGDVTIKSSSTNQVTIVLSGHPDTVENTTIDATDDSIGIRTRTDKQHMRFFPRRMDIVVSAPEGGSVRVSSASGDVRIRLAVDDLEINSGTGDVRVDENVGDVRIKIASGGVVVAHAERDADVTSASGDIRVRHAMDARITTASGRVVAGEVHGSASIKSASGDVRVKDFRGTDLDIATMSGDVVVGLASGRTVNAKIKTLSGDFRNKVKPTDGVKEGSMTLGVKSFSGDITLRSAK